MNDKQIYWIVGILALVTLTVGIFVIIREKQQPAVPKITKQAKTILPSNMKIENPLFKNNEYIPTKFTCDGINVNPALRISEVPAEAVSLALVMDDPDAPAGTWVHWVLWNIDPKTDNIKENSVPTGTVQGTTSASETRYMGPCPPNGAHRYFFKLYALDEKLNLPASTTAQLLEQAMQGHVIAQTETVGLYER